MDLKLTQNLVGRSVGRSVGDLTDSLLPSKAVRV